MWNIEGVVKEIRPVGRSAFFYVPAKEKTYLRNRHLIKVNSSLEYDQTEFDSCLALNVQDGKQAKKYILNQSQAHTKTEKLVSFDKLAFMGKLPLMAKLVDGKDCNFSITIRSL